MRTTYRLKERDKKRSH